MKIPGSSKTKNNEQLHVIRVTIQQQQRQQQQQQQQQNR